MPISECRIRSLRGWAGVLKSEAIVVSTLLAFTILPNMAYAAQGGPVFPSHRFPTDESFHLGYKYSYFHSDSNFSDSQSTDPLLLDSRLLVTKHNFQIEYQPTRHFSGGAYLNFDSVSLKDGGGHSIDKSHFGDQHIFFEYRFFDEPGASLGSAAVVKFPAYKNPTIDQLDRSGESSTILLGDAQSDFTALFTSEYWFSTVIRARGDLGYTFRTEEFSGEIPFYLSMAYVSPKLDLQLAFIGNFSAGNDNFNASGTDIDQVRQRFANSNYAYAVAPWVFAIQPRAEYWFTPAWAIEGAYKASLLGGSSPNFYEVRVGLTYRWAEADRRKRKTVREVDIKTDQEAGQFEGEDRLPAPDEPRGPQPTDVVPFSNQ